VVERIAGSIQSMEDWERHLYCKYDASQDSSGAGLGVKLQVPFWPLPAAKVPTPIRLATLPCRYREADKGEVGVTGLALLQVSINPPR